MTPFLQLRLWARRAPLAERLVAAGVGLVLAAVVALALVPAGGPGAPANNVVAAGTAGSTPAGGAGAGGAAPATTGGPGQAAAGSSAAGSTVTPGSGAASTAPGPGATSAGAGPSAGATTSACGALTATDQGVTASQVDIDVDVAELAGQAGNSLVGIPSAQEEEAIFQAAIDALNASGGVSCRRVVPKYYTADALDPSSLQAVCLNIVADHPFVLLDEGLGSPNGSPTPRDCPPSYKVPEFGTLALGQAEIKQYAPYLFGDNSTAEEIVNDWVFGARQLGWFSGPGKVGLLEQDCTPDINGIVLSDLAAIGIPTSTIKTFDFGCPDAIPPPSEVEEAVLEFKTAGVTRVMDDGGVYESYFSKDAAQQDYKPRYSVGDQASIALWDNPDFGPDPSNFSGGLAITATRYGAENTPGTVYNAATTTCDKAMAAKGLPPAEHSPDGFSGVACTLVTMFATAAAHASALQRSRLAGGLYQAGSLDFPFPIGPANFVASGGMHGGGFWRADTWVTSCACFRVSTPNFAPSFEPVP